MSIFTSILPKRKEQPKPINLVLPKGWNNLTTEQVEGVSRILIDHAKVFTTTGVWNRSELMCQCFFLLSGLEVIDGPFDPDPDTATIPSESSEGTPTDPDTATIPSESSEGPSSDPDLDPDLAPTELVDLHAHRYWLCQFADESKRRRYQTFEGEIRPIQITLAEIAELTVGHMEFESDKSDKPKECPGPLGWVLKPSDLTNFPYPELELPDPHAPTGKSRKQVKTITLQGPSPLMDGMTWRQYRISSDYMQYLQKIENNLLTIQKNSASYGTERLNRQRQLVNNVRAQFLANLFCRSIRHIDPETGQPTDGYFYVSTQGQDNAYLFESFPEEKYQSILLWWQGMMQYLSRQYPKVFRTEKKIGKADPLNDPLKLYTRSTTTMIKYAGSSEEEINRTSYSIILQHMNDMADENDAMKEIRNKH